MHGQRQQGNESNFFVFFDKVSWFAITAIAIYVASQLNRMSDSVVKLNENVAVIVNQMQYTERTLDRHSSDIKMLNETVYHSKPSQ